jgi:hypothetical protein
LSASAIKLITEQYECSVDSVLQDGPISLKHAIRITYQISSALAYLHGNRLYHCAVKASNVVLTQRTHSDPSAKLSMFSACRFAGEDTRAKFAKQDKIDYTVFFLYVVFSGRSTRKHDFGIDQVSEKESEHKEAAAEILNSLIRSNSEADVFSDLADKLFALDAEIRRASDGLEQVFLFGDRDPDQDNRLSEDRESDAPDSHDFRREGRVGIDWGEERRARLSL